MTKHLLWIDLEKGWICLEHKIDDEHHCYEHIEIYVEGKEKRIYPTLGKEREFHE